MAAIEFLAAEFDLSVVLTTAIAAQAKYVVLAHNHPQGSEIPSPNDIAVTRKLQFLLKEVNITLKEHFIVTRSKCIPIMDSQFFQPLKMPDF